MWLRDAGSQEDNEDRLESRCRSAPPTRGEVELERALPYLRDAALLPR